MACAKKLQASWYFVGRSFYGQNLGWWWWDLWLSSDCLMVGNGVVILLCIFLEEEPGLCLNAALFCLVFPSIISASPSFPGYQFESVWINLNQFESALWNSGKVKEAKRSLFPTNKIIGTQRWFVFQSPIGTCSFQMIFKVKVCSLLEKWKSCLQWGITSHSKNEHHQKTYK